MYPCFSIMKCIYILMLADVQSMGAIESQPTFFGQLTIEKDKAILLLYPHSPVFEKARDVSDAHQHFVDNPGAVIYQQWRFFPTYIELKDNYALHATSSMFADYLLQQPDSIRQLFKGLAYSTMCFTLDVFQESKIVTEDTTVLIYAMGEKKGKPETGLFSMYEKWGFTKDPSKSEKDYLMGIKRDYVASVKDVQALCRKQSTQQFDKTLIKVRDLRMPWYSRLKRRRKRKR